jgi:hypothetical protein
MLNLPKYFGASLKTGAARAIRIKKTDGAKPKLSGPLVGSCNPVPGGTPEIKAPAYSLAVKNGPVNLGDCNQWQDDDEQLFKEDNNDLICIDNA